MNHKTWSLTLGSAVAASISLSPIVQAAENPFAMQTLAAPSLVAEAGEKMKDGKCGEGKCGGKRKAVESKAKDGNCGANKMKEGGCSASKMKEGGCSGNMKMDETAPATP
jgi:uncharacterized low-complexity protein